MGLELSAVGTSTEVFRHRYTWRDQALYALGIGARKDELAHLYEGVEGGIKVFPTYAVVPAFAPIFELLGRANADLTMLVHGGQKVTAHRPAPPEAELETVATLVAVYDLKRFAQLVIETRTTADGAPLFDTEWSLIVRGAGGFGGGRPPPDDDRARLPKGAEPAWTVTEETREEQALLYRLNGDVNPLHADPAFAARVGFEQGPILHGLCTYGHVARAVIRASAGGDAARLRTLSAQFRKPVWPGETLVTEGFPLDDGRIALRASVQGKPDPVVTNAYAIVG